MKVNSDGDPFLVNESEYIIASTDSLAYLAGNELFGYAKRASTKERQASSFEVLNHEGKKVFPDLFDNKIKPH